MLRYKRTKRGGIIMNTDNAEERRTVEHCFRTGRVLVNPIIDWEEQDVWQFIKQRNIKYCSLYDLGFKRLGCVGCPMATQSEKIKQLEQNPGIKKMYLAAFTEMLKQRERRGLQTKLWKTADDVMQWWIYENKSIDQIDGQMDILEQLEEYEQ